MKEFDTTLWNRKDQYEFFKNYEDPFFNLTTKLDVTQLYDYCKRKNISFFLGCLYLAIESANEIVEFRLRINKGKLVEFESIDIGSTVLNEDNTFSFCYFNRKDSIIEFDTAGKIILSRHRLEQQFESKENAINLIYCSTIPWIDFTSIKHARSKEREESGIPKFVFGKFVEFEGVKMIPFSIEVHHALMDGYHVGEFLDKFQKKINSLK